MGGGVTRIARTDTGWGKTRTDSLPTGPFIAAQTQNQSCFGPGENPGFRTKIKCAANAQMRWAYPQAGSAQGAIPAPAQRSQRRNLDASCSSRTRKMPHFMTTATGSYSPLFTTPSPRHRCYIGTLRSDSCHRSGYRRRTGVVPVSIFKKRLRF